MGILIHTRVVIDMATMETLEDECFEYNGQLALCGGSGGGSSTTNTVDYAYNARMAALSEEQQQWAREYFGVWQDYQKPYEIAQAQANLSMLPLETEIYKNQLGTANALLPLEAEYARGQLQAANQMLPQETALYGQQLNAASKLIPQQTEAASKFLTAALDGVDVNERMALAAADTSNAWKDARSASNRANARIGVNPNSGRYQGIMAAMDTQQAAQVAGAKTQARVGAEQENFNRLVQAVNFNGANQILQSGQLVKPRTSGASNEILQGIGYLKG